MAQTARKTTAAPAVQVLPREADYVNIHPNCLHLWAPAEA